jgi:hypothetical protein
LFD